MPNILLNLCLLFLCALAEKCIQEPKAKYKFINEKVTFLDGYIRCKQLGMDAVEIITKEEQEELESLIPDPSAYVEFWIFATNLGTKPTYYWLNSGRPIVFSNYNKNEPNNAGDKENCLLMFKRQGGKLKWNDVPCDIKVQFICQNPSRSQNEESFQRQLQLRNEQWLKNSSLLIREANSNNLEKFNELAATIEATKHGIEELNEKVHRSQNEESFPKQLHLRDEQLMKNSSLLIDKANSKNLEKFNELAATMEATKRGIEELNKKVHSDELCQKQLQLKDEQCLNKSNQLIDETNSRNLQKISECNATLEATTRENEELKEKIQRQCPTGGDIGDILI